MSSLEANKSIDYWLEKLKMTEYKYQLAEKLSKGNQQKIQFITAVMHDPELIVLDEPFSGLDPVNTDILKNVIFELVKKEKYIVMSSHQMNSIEELCEEIVILDKGKMVLSGNLNNIKETYKTNKIEVITKDDISNLVEENGLKIYSQDNKKYIISVENEIQANQLLKSFVDKEIKIEKFELVKPTLHEIFVEKVGE